MICTAENVLNSPSSHVFSIEFQAKVTLKLVKLSERIYFLLRSSRNKQWNSVLEEFEGKIVLSRTGISLQTFLCVKPCLRVGRYGELWRCFEQVILAIISKTRLTNYLQRYSIHFSRIAVGFRGVISAYSVGAGVYSQPAARCAAWGVTVAGKWGMLAAEGMVGKIIVSTRVLEVSTFFSSARLGSLTAQM